MDKVAKNRLRFLTEFGKAHASGDRPGSFADEVAMRGGVLVQRRWRDGRVDVVVEDPNLIVTLGRRVMSRVISGAVNSPTVLRGTQPAIRILRNTANVGGASPTSAWVTFYQEAGTANFRFQLWAKGSGSAVKEFESVFVGGVKNVNQLVADVNAAATNWVCAVVGTTGLTDATLLQPTHPAGAAFALGNQSSYTAPALGTSAYVCELRVAKSVEQAVSLSDLKVDRLRFGTEGYDPATPLVGKDVLATDEWMNSPLRAIDYNKAFGSDYATVVTAYTNSAQVSFTGVLTQSDANGRYISEFGLYTSGNLMVAKKNSGQIAKTSLFSLECTWTLIF